MPIIISKNGKNAKKIEKTMIKKEDYLQKYIYDNPGSIPLYDIKEDVRLLIVAREYPTQSGPIDALGIDGDGEIYVIETKLYKNPDKRLVVAQVLDYGASLWNTYTNYADFFSLMEKEIEKEFKVGTNEKLMETFQISDNELPVLYDNIKSNLSEGNYKFIVLMDQLHARLKDLIVYLNQNSQFDIYAVEMEYYKHDEMEIVIPKIFGAEVKKDKNIVVASGNRKKWDEDSYFAELEKNLQGDKLESVKRLYKFSKDNSDWIAWGTGIVNGSFNPKISSLGTGAPYTVFTDGKLELNFGGLNDNDATRQKRKMFFEALLKIKEFNVPKNSIEKYPRVPIEAWYDKLDLFISIVERTLLSPQNES
jgi:hypothetical protein